MVNQTWSSLDDFIFDKARKSSITLNELQYKESALRRFDSKYVLKEKELIDVLSKLNSEWTILNVENKFQINYKTLYFDTDKFQLFKDHKKGRRKRFKIRIRFYETGDSYLELKLKTNLQETLKFRWQFFGSPKCKVIEPEFEELVSKKLKEYLYRFDLHTLEYKLNTEYTRMTLYNAATKEKLTIDKKFIVSNQDVSLPISKSMLILEIKSSKSLSSLNSNLNSLNIRRVNLSKYGVGAAALYSYLGKHPWVSTFKLFEEQS
jgi:hypothetical protein